MACTKTEKRTLASAALKKNCIRSTIQRNVELPPDCGAVLKVANGLNRPTKSQIEEGANCMPGPCIASGAANAYATPQLNSALQHVKEVEALQAMEFPKYKSTSDLTPRSKAIIVPKIAQKLNFNTGVVVFKNLTPLNVNDSILLPRDAACRRRKFVKSVNKTPTPDLADFLEPLPPLQHFIHEPDLKRIFCDSSIDPFTKYLRMLD